MRRPVEEEALNAATHGCGFLLATAATVWLIFRLWESESLASVIGIACVVYGFTLIGLYLMSTLSHVFMRAPWHSRFRRLDQGFIYLLILGTYSPLAALFLKTATAWALFGVMWSLAIVGCVSKICLSHRVEHVSIAIYVLLGWGPALIGFPLGDHALLRAFYWMAAGGIVYCAGIFFLLQDKRVWYFHGIWHVFVIGGSAIHFYAIVNFVFGDRIPPSVSP